MQLFDNIQAFEAVVLQLPMLQSGASRSLHFQFPSATLFGEIQRKKVEIAPKLLSLGQAEANTRVGPNTALHLFLTGGCNILRHIQYLAAVKLVPQSEDDGIVEVVS